MDRRLQPAVAFAGLVLVASLVPVPESGGTVPALFGIAADKWVHATSYGVLTGLVVWGRSHRSLLAVVAVVAAVAVYGAGIECLQWFVPTRGLSALDALANALGAACGGAVWLAVAARLSASAERARA